MQYKSKTLVELPSTCTILYSVSRARYELQARPELFNPPVNKQFQIPIDLVEAKMKIFEDEVKRNHVGAVPM